MKAPVAARPVVCLDLDRTVIYSAAALDIRVPDAEAPRLLCVELYRGKPLSFMTERAVEALRALQDVAVVVPTTTRTREQLARVHLPGPPARYAIASNGGHLLVDGEPDPAWTAAVRQRLRDCAPLAEVQAYLRSRGGEFVLNLRTASDLFAYAVVDRAALPAGWVADLAAWCAPRDWTVSLQGRKVYAVPRPLTKSAAAREVVARVGGHTLLAAAGDSLLDADLLTAADLAIRPAHGELSDAGFTLDHLVVTTCTGVAAGEELLGWLAGWASPSPSLAFLARCDYRAPELEGSSPHMALWDQLKQRTKDMTESTKTQVGKFKNKEFANASMAMCALIAAADGSIDAEERRKTAGFISSNDVLSVFTASELLEKFNFYAGKLESDYDFGKVEAIATLGKLKKNPAAARAVIQVGIIIGGADGNFDKDEQQAVREACNAVGIPPAEFDL